MNKGWEIVKLGDYIQQVRGVSYTPKDLSPELTNEYLMLLRANNIQDVLVFDDVQYVHRSKVSEKQYIRKGDILICASSGSKNLVGKAAQAHQEYDACFGAFCKLIRPIKINSAYLGNYFKSNYYRSEISRLSRGININNIKNEDIDNLLIPLPPLEDQLQIAATLGKASGLISLRKKQLEELDALAESVFYDMFGDPVKNEKGWEIMPLRLLTTKIGSGATPKGGNSSYKSHGISLIRSLNVYNGRFQYKDLAHINENQAEKLKNVTIQKGDILLNITGASVARCCIVPDDLVPARVNQHVAIIRVNKNGNNKYLMSLITSNQFQDKLLRLSKSNGATREALTKNDIENLEISMPPINLQTQFAAIIEKIELQKALVRKALRESEDLFQRLMQDLFKPD
ncbi:MAG: restriction endonuclease subunit S [Bacteroidales bacterium]|jgi:type I restriction enzyme S subunit|nr:restriction endonuclease subunit S [Bacteroidales bacterium]